VLDIIRREIGEVGQIGSVGRTFSWSVSNQNRKLQISVMPRGGRTTVRIDEQINNIAGGVFGGIMGGGGGGLGGAMMGAIAGGAHQPLLGLAAWLATIATSFGAARFTLGRIAKSKQEKLREVAHMLANQIAESTASAEPTDSRKRIGSG
jgi:predicted lipid-binding transport protein (Tim44 family)